MPNKVETRKRAVKEFAAHVRRQFAVLREQKRTLQAELEKLILTGIVCTNCNKEFALAYYVFVQTFDIQPSYGPQGPYEVEFKIEVCRLNCPECKHPRYFSTSPFDEVIIEGIEQFTPQKIFLEVTREPINGPIQASSK